MEQNANPPEQHLRSGFVTRRKIVATLLIAVVVVVGVVIVHLRQVADAKNPYKGIALPQTYTDPDGFTLRYPANWRNVTSNSASDAANGGKGQLVPVALKGRVAALLVVTSDSTDTTVANYFNTYHAKSLVITQATNMTINGYPTYYVVGVSAGIAYRIYTIEHGTNVATLSFVSQIQPAAAGAPTQDYASYNHIEDAIAHSIHLGE